MKKLINLYKPLGLTPLQSIQEFKEINKNYKNKKMSYPGRLDPMAEGVLLILVGNENKKMKSYMKLDKEYRTEILFGVKSDTGDILGIASLPTSLSTNLPVNQPVLNREENKINETINNYQSDIEELIKKLKKKIKSLKGGYEQKIPSFSSYKIKGKPMFYYAKKGEIFEIRKHVNIKSIRINNTYFINNKKLLKNILRKIDLVKGDFRQNEIKQRWKELLDSENKKFLVVDLTINCSSGTYIRAIADDLGSNYDGGLLMSLKRTKVGRFEIKDSLSL